MKTVTRSISLNSDLGEGFGAYAIADDETLLGLVSDANVACGFHGGDPRIMRRTCEIAAARGLGVGAHFGFDDIRGFGRRHLEVPRDELRDDIVYQIGGLQAVAKAAGAQVRYVKAHGALYHSALKYPDYAAAMLDAIVECAPDLPMLCQPGTTLARDAEARGMPLLREGFIDRTYQDDGLLTPRSQPGALVTDPELAGSRALRMALEGTVETVSGKVIPMEVDSLCIHSDSPGAVEMARSARAALEGGGVAVTSMV
jgi:UPF0271 protein